MADYYTPVICDLQATQFTYKSPGCNLRQMSCAMAKKEGKKEVDICILSAFKQLQLNKEVSLKEHECHYLSKILFLFNQHDPIENIHSVMKKEYKMISKNYNQLRTLIYEQVEKDYTEQFKTQSIMESDVPEEIINQMNQQEAIQHTYFSSAQKSMIPCKFISQIQKEKPNFNVGLWESIIDPLKMLLLGQEITTELRTFLGKFKSHHFL